MRDQNKEIFTMTEPQLRYGVVGVLLILCLSFIAGYYWGKKKAYEEFFALCRTDSFQDKIAATLCSLYAADENDAEAEQELEQSEFNDSVQVTQKDVKPSDVEKDLPPSVLSPETKYFAELAGFGTVLQAKSYAKRLEKREVKAVVIEHKSRTARGKTRTWYQVVTLPMGYDELQGLVDKIKIEDHLQGVTLVEFSHKYKDRFERALT